jgi:DNA repair exonuclease SbcCD ATPase subunit
VLFPVVVIAAALVALAAGAVGFYFLFQRGESRIVRAAVGTITAEGTLIQEVRREADARIQEKNLEINQIQGRLTEIDQERQDLRSNMDAKVSQKERELREQMAAALEAERQKLQKQGLSTQTIRLRIQEMEARKTREFQRQLEGYRKQAEAERAQTEQNLKALQAEFTASLSKANAERQSVISEAEKRENELRSQFAQKTQALESERERAQQAEQAIAALAAQREKEDLALSQLTGLYAVVRSDIAQRDYDKAIASLQAVRDFVGKPELASLPALARRREFDLFVVDSLTSLSQGEREAAKTETATLVEAANQVTTVRTTVQEADGLLAAGKTAEAEKAYADALQVLPEVAASYGYFVARDKAAEAARQARLAQGLDRAESAFAAGSFSDSASAYRDALSYLPVGSPRLDQVLRNLLAAGSVAGSQELRRTQSRAAAGALTQADGLRSDGKSEEALAAYLDLLSKYPLSLQSAAALQGIRETVKGMSEKSASALRKEQEDLGAQIASLQKDLAARRSDLSSSQDSLAAARQENARLLARIDTLTADLKSASQLASQGLSATQRLRALIDRIDSMQRSYKEYTGREDPVLAAKGQQGLLDTKPALDSFLGSAGMEETFPGLLARIKRYDQAFQSSGRSDALQEAVSVVIDYSRQQTAEKRRQFFLDRLKAFQRDPDMTDFIQEMQKLAR